MADQTTSQGTPRDTTRQQTDKGTTSAQGVGAGSAEGSPASGYQRGTGVDTGAAGGASQVHGGSQGPRSERAQGGSIESQRGLQPSARRGLREARGLSDPWAMSPFGGDPFAMMRRLTHEMDRLFESFGMPSIGSGPMQSAGLQDAPTLWAPHVDVFERDGRLVVQAELPGIPRENIGVEIDQDTLVITGQRSQESTRNERGLYHSERRYGSFHRAIPLPEGVDPDSARASFRDGVLEVDIELPKSRARGRRLEIHDAGGAIEGRVASGTSQDQRPTGSAAGSASSGSSAASRSETGAGGGMPGAEDVRTARPGLPGSDGFGG